MNPVVKSFLFGLVSHAIAAEPEIAEELAHLIDEELAKVEDELEPEGDPSAEADAAKAVGSVPPAAAPVPALAAGTVGTNVKVH